MNTSSIFITQILTTESKRSFCFVVGTFRANAVSASKHANSMKISY